MHSGYQRGVVRAAFLGCVIRLCRVTWVLKSARRDRPVNGHVDLVIGGQLVGSQAMASKWQATPVMVYSSLHAQTRDDEPDLSVPVDRNDESIGYRLLLGGEVRTKQTIGQRRSKTLSLKQRENDLKRRTGKFLASLAIAGAVVFGVAGHAQASDTYNNVCDSQEFCLFNEANFQGFYVWDTMDMENENYQGWRYPYNGPGINDNSWSLKNRGWWYGIDSCVDSYWRGPCFSTSAGYSRSDLWSINGLSFADKLSSHY